MYRNTSLKDREFWRAECEKRKNIILIATYGLLQSGTNIKSLKYILLASPFKSKIRVLQSIGRSLRKHSDKTDGAIIYDIIDNCKILDDHGRKRLKYYELEDFDIKHKIYNEGNALV
jgi:superfamily II DNA or RNA helicase